MEKKYRRKVLHKPDKCHTMDIAPAVINRNHPSSREVNNKIFLK
ncbi:hypothetical protein [Bacillus sp. J33]|nr:hypothetical protein [Bacillus sp. J33]